MDHSFLCHKPTPSTFSHFAQVRCLEVCTSSSHSHQAPALPRECSPLCPLLHPSATASGPPAGFLSCLDFCSLLTTLPASSQTVCNLPCLVPKCFLQNLLSLFKTLPWLIIALEITSVFRSMQPSPFNVCLRCFSSLLCHHLLHPLL